MARFLDFILLLLLVTSVNFLAFEARPLNILKIHDSGFGSGFGNVATFDWLTLGSIKDGPSPGVGHKFTTSQTVGGIKAGPSPGEGHKVVTGNHQ
ncbi:PAMP-induced secreted peptide 2-like [Lycium ferocissimum]|uniref:PAMP-induced secreted peptide 2-like n=1 Tax=Lycium ferocissimum TaxID=112874 RepID=UPI002814F70F|nr:PAMP-induced secreted peptide 2-like [Lycium ferocissimum]